MLQFCLLVFLCSTAIADKTEHHVEPCIAFLPATSYVTPELRAEESAKAIKAQKALLKSPPIDMKKAIEGILSKKATSEVTNAMSPQEFQKELQAELRGCVTKSGEMIMEGDILTGMTEDQYRNAFKSKHGKREIVPSKLFPIWDVVIPYELPKPNDKNGRMLKAISEAIDEITKEIGCLKFVQRFNDGKSNKNKQKNGRREAYIRFVRDKNLCYSRIRKILQGGQDISIGRDCEYKGTVIHEIMHALGFLHEHNRFDRDEYIEVVKDNIKRTWRTKQEFVRYPYHFTGIDKFFPYDYGSIMHYPDWAFSVEPSEKVTIKVKRDYPQWKLGQRKRMSRTDIAQIKELYCKNAESIEEYVKHPNVKDNKYVAVAVECYVGADLD